MKHAPVDRSLGICIYNVAQSAHRYSYSRISLFLLANASGRVHAGYHSGLDRMSCLLLDKNRHVSHARGHATQFLILVTGLL